MDKLVKGLHQFQSDVFSTKKRLFEGLVQGQQPLALFITCSDSRISPNLLTQTEPGELFVMRNVGNIIPPYGQGDGGAAATIEYAVSVLGVKDIIVCGHSHCGAMGSLIDGSDLEKNSAIKSWLAHAASTQQIIEQNYAHIAASQDRLAATIQENVLVQLEHLQTHPSVVAAVDRKALSFHGWVYKFETGEVLAFDTQLGQFKNIR